jgi:hypothetical protein
MAYRIQLLDLRATFWRDISDLQMLKDGYSGKPKLQHYGPFNSWFLERSSKRVPSVLKSLEGLYLTVQRHEHLGVERNGL